MKKIETRITNPNLLEKEIEKLRNLLGDKYEETEVTIRLLGDRSKNSSRNWIKPSGHKSYMGEKE